MPKLISLWPLFILVGLIIGMGSYTFIYGKGYSYISDNPKACLNCHIMQDQYNSWVSNPHGKATTCNSCHTPENFYMKYLVKAENGFNHAWKFTTGNFKEPIRIRQHNFNITMKSCFKCHAHLLDSTFHQEEIIKGRSCVQCHKNVGHTH
jgi:cytochrome c nitrite reductase small subunit